ncbi:non-specific lipid transfer protein GPI-anchored 1 [Arachis ipaensis]|uniref:non-specific lipid transfer protein GPI-anchored 1 n=1 Tax=Arachis ipaensis TaxID=130454 RepID=UPI0007AF3D89|nr:non-specific lipid transfer protein GPI-anchored 1 [Arachis ipaensis]
MRRSGSRLYLLVLLVLVAVEVEVEVEGADALAGKCSTVVQQVIPCLNFATGQAQVPSKECCDASSKIKDSAPECLCYVIQQTHKGSPEVKSMGIQEARLIQLPSACKLKNASISNCPKLLGLSPGSADAQIFTNISSSSNSSTASPSTSSSSSSATPTSQNDSHGTMLRPPLMADITALMALPMLLLVLPTATVTLYS